MTEPRARIEIVLDGGTAGTIPLVDLAQLSQHLQELTHRLTRSLQDRDGSTGNPRSLQRLSDLVAVGIRSGSAVLEVEAPAWNDELGFDDLEPDAGVQALGLVLAGLERAESGSPLPKQYTELARKSLREFVAAARPYDRMSLSLSHHNEHKTISVQPALVALPALAEEPTREEGQVEGELYALNSHSGLYQVEDNTGYTVKCHADPESSMARDLEDAIRHTVRLSGLITRDPGGRIKDIDVKSVETVETSAAGWEFDLESAIDGTAPIDPSEFIIPDLSEEEAQAFLDAIESA